MVDSNKVSLTKVFILLLLLLTGVEVGRSRAQAGNPFPADSWGVYSWGGWDKVTRASHPLIKGVPLVLKWSNVEPEPGVFRFEDELGQRLERLKQDGFYAFVMIWVAPDAPRWLYANGVPEVEMTATLNPLGYPRDKTFQYYLDENYVSYYHRLLRVFGTYIRQLPPDLQSRILFVQSAEGSTGDGQGYKGAPLDANYNISNEQWGDFRIQAWEVLKEALTDEHGHMVKPMLVNYDSNGGKHYDWLLDNLDVIGLKNGMFSHGYHISETQSRLAQWRQFNDEVKRQGKQFFSRGEQDGEWDHYGWSTKNRAQGLYWSGIFAAHCGLDMWNLPWEACEGYVYKEAIEFFNKYAGQHEPKTAKSAFCAFRQGLDASNTVLFPENIYGEANKKNISRYLKIAEAYRSEGAIQADPEKAIGGGMVNRQREGYNDVGWKILEGNYEKHLRQIRPDETSIGLWHTGPTASIYGRFARSTKVDDGKNALYFDLDDEFYTASQPVAVKVIWLDQGSAAWELRYDAKDQADKTAFAVQNSNSGEWKSKTIMLTDANFSNQSENGSDLYLINTSNEDVTFHLIELEKKGASAGPNPNDKVTVTERKDVKLFILSGQSNAAGAGNGALLPPEFRETDEEVLLLEKGAWRPMGPRSRVADKFGITETAFGAELAFASEMKKRYPNHIIAIAKVAISGGTSIVAWDKDYLRADWLDDLREVNNEEKASLLLYDRLIADSRNGIELLKKRADVKDVEVCGMLWLQTEKDGRMLETVHKYEPRLKAFMKNIREDLGLPELPFLIMDAHISRPNKVVQQAMLRKVAKEDGRVKIIKCDDLATHEGVHFNTEGMLRMGKRFAAAYINLEPLKPNRK